jgi:amino acid permease
MDNLNTICSKWGSMAIICLACGAMIYHEHIRSCPRQPNVNDIKNSLKYGMKRHFKLPSISNWPLLLSLFIIYIAIIAKFYTLHVVVGGFVSTIIIYRMVDLYLQKACQMQFKEQIESCDPVNPIYSNQNIFLAYTTYFKRFKYN